jgi:hypothetical protein
VSAYEIVKYCEDVATEFGDGTLSVCCDSCHDVELGDAVYVICCRMQDLLPTEENL